MGVLPACTRTHRLCAVPMETERWCWIPGTDVTDGCESLCGCWESNFSLEVGVFFKRGFVLVSCCCYNIVPYILWLKTKQTFSLGSVDFKSIKGLPGPRSGRQQYVPSGEESLSS